MTEVAGFEAGGLVLGRAAARASVEVLDAAGSARIEEPWRALSLAVEHPSCFASPSYLRAWLATLSDDVEPFVLAVPRGGELVGVMPMMRARVRRGPKGAPRHDFAPSDRALLGRGRPRPFPLRQISPVVSMPASLVGPAPLCRAEDRREVVHALAGRIAGLGRWDVLAIPADAGPAQEDWCEALAAAGLAPWVLPLGRRIGAIGRVEPFAEKVARQKKKFRQNIRRAQADAVEAGLAVEVHEGREAVAARMPELAAVAAASWKDRGREELELAVPYAGRQRRFLETLIADPASGRDLVPVLAMARLGAEPVAALLSLRHGTCLTAIVTFRSETLPQASPGMLVLGRTIDWAAENGMDAFDLNATHEWTRHLIDEERSQDVVVCFSRGLRGRAMGLVSALARRRG